MKNQLFYLKPNVVIEPLFDQWYAWAHLVSPATAAKNITGRHLKIMDSFIQAPHIHKAAVLNPKMKGGPFMDIDLSRKHEVEELRNQTLSKRETLIQFSKSLEELEDILTQKADGFSMDKLYDLVPGNIKGYVELVYDLNNNPSFRIFESLLYESEFYDESTQSISMFLTENDERPFVLSTPRLEEQNVLQLDIPFKSKLIDELSKLKREPRSLEEIKRLVDLEKDGMELFLSFFTEEAPVEYNKYNGDLIRMRYFGHACILVETASVSILVDPIISYYGYQSEVARYTDQDLPNTIDYVLITHNHQDHILLETLLPLRHKIKNLIVPKTTSGSLQDPNVKLMFEKIGFDQVIEIGDMESIKFEDCEITGLPFIGEHSDLNIHAKICHHVTIGEFSLLFAADSCNIEPRLYQHVRRIIGDIDVVFLGMECDGAPLSWLYGPLLNKELPRDMDNSRRLAGSNYERGKALIDEFNPKEVYVYAMGQEPWLEFISSIKYTEDSNPIIASNKLTKVCNNQGKVAERLFGEKELLYCKSKSPIEND